MKTILTGKWVLDSNILIYSLDKTSLLHPQCLEVFKLVKDEKIKGVIAIQNIIESERILIQRYKLSPAKTVELLNDLIDLFYLEVIAPKKTTYLTFHTLIVDHSEGMDVYDFFLCATMLDNGIDQILTNNQKDFKGIKEIRAVNPFDTR